MSNCILILIFGLYDIIFGLHTVILYTFKFQSNFKSDFERDKNLLISFHRFFQEQIFASHTVARKTIQSKMVKRYMSMFVVATEPNFY